MKTKLAVAAALLALAGCYSLTPQDQTALQTAQQLAAGAYCRIQDADAGAARALIRADYAEVSGVLRRAGIDAGVQEAGPSCP